MLARLWLFLFVGLVSQTAPAAESKVPIGTTVADFALDDYRGKSHRLGGYDAAPVVVLAVLGTECPLAKLYTTRLQEVSDRYADRGVVFLGLNANAQDSITEIAAYARQHQLKFPVLKDLNQSVVDAIGATRTPEVVVLDAGRAIRYRGRIDDRYGIGYSKDAPSQDYLSLAIEALLAGRAVATAEIEPLGCLIGRAKTPQPASSTTFTGEVAAILNRHCVECHREGEIAPFPLTDYDSASGWAEMIAEVVRENRMPPWHAAEPVDGASSHDEKHLTYAHGVAFANRRGLTDEERQTLYDWAAAGAPQGEGSAPRFVAETTTVWQLPSEPDVVFPMADKPFTVPAEGDVKYQYFKVATNFDEDKWIRGAEILPGNRAVVHHVLVMVSETGRNDPRGIGNGEFLAAFVPGLKAVTYPAGMAKLVPAGAELIFQVHYTPVGSPQSDVSKIGLLFANPEAVQHVVQTRAAINENFELVPHESGQRVDAGSTIPYESAQLLALMPHMHVRGQAFRYTLERGDETTTLLDIPRYDFNWQTCYRLATPIALKKGDRVVGEGWFDNSTANLANPDATATVRWGDQTWEEMMIGYFDIAIPLSDRQQSDVASGEFTLAPAKADSDESRKAIRDRVRETFDRFDTNNSGTLSRSEVPERLRQVHRSIDMNMDGVVDQVEMRRAYDRQERRMRILNASQR